MKKIKLIFPLLVMVLFTISCKKEHALVSTTSTPEFYFNGTISGVSTSLNAGVNNYYMYSSYIQDSNNVYNFIGDLKQTTSNLNSIQIQINDYKVSVFNSSAHIDSSLTPKNYPYYIPGTATTDTSTVYQVQFNSSYANGTAQAYSWSFGDGATSTLANPTHTYSHLGRYEVCLSITGTNSCSNNICDSINLSSPTAYACYTGITSTILPNNGVAFVNITSGTRPFSYLWNFGELGSSNDTATSPNPTHYYSDSSVYQVSLQVTDSFGHKAVATYKVSTAIVAPTCLTNFNVANIQPITTINTFEYGDVIVTWTDASGNVYTSKNSAQPSSSSFQIISVDNYQNNTNNQRTKKVHVKFNCWLYNATHSPIQITNADAVIALAYK